MNIKKYNNISGTKNLKNYLIGYVLCIILSAIPFLLVTKKILSPHTTIFIIAILAAIQLIVQVHYFIRLNTTGRWSFVAFCFTVFVIIVLFGGSLWIMCNLNYNMMIM